jgi:hypothetical protein
MAGGIRETSTLSSSSSILPISDIPHQNDSVKQYMSKFIRNESHPYTIITPDTPLAELAEFLNDNIFALGEPSLTYSTAPCTNDSLVTDSNRKFVLAVATSQDLEVGVIHSFAWTPTYLFYRTLFLAGVYDTCVTTHILNITQTT